MVQQGDGKGHVATGKLIEQPILRFYIDRTEMIQNQPRFEGIAGLNIGLDLLDHVFRIQFSHTSPLLFENTLLFHEPVDTEPTDHIQPST